VEQLVWSAARRLAWLVAGAMAMVSVPYWGGARMGVLPAAAGGLAALLFVGALLPLIRAGRILRQAEVPPAGPPPPLVYRSSARPWDPEGLELQATHLGAIALLLLGLAAALVVVAAAAR
jgi:hypothetical protein